MPVVVVLSLLLAACAQAQRSSDGGGEGRAPRPDPTAGPSDPTPGGRGRFLVRAVEVGGARHAYQVYVPARVGADTPVILFLHGSGERGDDNRSQVAVALGPHIRAHPDFPAIAVFPQSPAGRSWDGDVAAAALAALDASMKELGGDPRRVYLTGLSRGGYGVWEIAYAHPERFAALVPICGGVRSPRPDWDLQVGAVAGEADPHAALAARLAAIPTWIFHGALDDIVPPAESRRMAEALQAAGGEVRLTVFPTANHNSWDPAYADPALWAWLFAQRRPAR